MIDFMDIAVAEYRARKWREWELSKFHILTRHLMEAGFKYNEDGRYTYPGCSLQIHRLNLKVNKAPTFSGYHVLHLYVDNDKRDCKLSGYAMRTLCNGADAARQYLTASIFPFQLIKEDGAFEDRNRVLHPELTKAVMRLARKWGFHYTKSYTAQTRKPIVVRPPLTTFERNPFPMPPDERASETMIINCDTITMQ